MSGFGGLSIVIPTVDETNAIAKTVEIINEICSPEDIKEILIIYGDKSSKEHIKALFSLAARFSELHIKVLKQPGRGLGDALFFGCNISEGSHFFMIGADRENDTYALKELLRLAKLRPDTVITTSRKLGEDGFKEYSLIKRVLGSVFTFLCRICFRSKQTDITYAYQITPKSIFDISFFSDDHSAFVLELALLPDIKNIPVIEIPTVIDRRREGVSHSGVKYYFGFAKTAVRLFINMKAGKIR